MTFGRKRAWTAVVGVHVAVLVASASVGMKLDGGEEGQAQSAFAAAHCTRYAPGYDVDTNCSGSGWISPNSYSTHATALRDLNYIYLDTTAWIWVWYSGLDASRMYSTYNAQGPVSGYRYAYCQLDDVTRWGRWRN